MGKSGITWCIIHKDIHQTVDSPAFQRWKMWITRLCIVEKWGKTPSYILWTAIKLPTRYRCYPHSSTIIHELSTPSKCRDYRTGIVQATSSETGATVSPLPVTFCTIAGLLLLVAVTHERRKMQSCNNLKHSPQTV